MNGDVDHRARQGSARRAESLTGKGSAARVVSQGDDDLLARCRQGDAASWDALVVRYERLVFSVALRNGLDREDAADVTQTVFLSLLRSIDQIHREERLASWLMTVARRHAWRIRSKKSLETPVTTTPETGNEIDDPIAEWERGRAVQTMVAALGSPCRDLLTAMYLDPVEPSYREISNRYGWAVGSLGPMRARCLQRVRQLMRHEEFR